MVNHKSSHARAEGCAHAVHVSERESALGKRIKTEGATSLHLSPPVAASEITA